MYSDLFHCTAQFNTLPEYEHKDLKDKLDALEDFDRIQPMATKYSDLKAKCACSDCYSKLCCVGTVGFSMLYNPSCLATLAYRCPARSVGFR